MRMQVEATKEAKVAASKRTCDRFRLLLRRLFWGSPVDHEHFEPRFLILARKKQNIVRVYEFSASEITLLAAQLAF